MPVWMQNLMSSLRDRPVAILHGNVRDKYIDGHAVHVDLTALLRYVAEKLGQSRAPFVEQIFYDCLGEERRLRMSGVAAPAPPPTNLHPGLLDDGDGPAPAQRQAAPQQPRRVEPPTAVATWLRELSSPNENRIAVLYYLDKLIAYETSYAEKDRQLLVWLEKLIDKITPNNRLILVALRDTMIPVELFTHAPKVFVQPIPMPDAQDREAYLRRLLEDLLRAGKLKPERFTLLANLTDGLFLRDLDNLARSIGQATDLSEANLRRLLNQYRLGEQKDYFGQLDIRRIDSIVSWFEKKEGVHGQTEAVERLREVLTVARAGLSGVAAGTAAKPKGVLFFAGPTGVGKTLVAKKLAKFLFDNETAFLRFDMSEFKEEHTVSKLIGSPPGYIGSEQGGMLTNAVREKPFSVVLFDEIEKAHAKIMDIFLQILDEGRLTDSRGQTVFFTETIIVFTSNLGTRAQERSRLDAVRNDRSLDVRARKEKSREHFIQCVSDFFRLEISRPELLNRIGRNVIPFNFIDTPEIQKGIFLSILKRIKSSTEDLHRPNGHQVVYSDGLADWLASRYGGRVAEFGGRGIVDCLDAEIILPLAEKILCAEARGQRQIKFHVAVSQDGKRIDVEPSGGGS